MIIARRVIPGLPETRTARSTALSGTQVLLGTLPFLFMAAVACIDLLAGSRAGFLPLLSLGPALAAVSIRPVRTALIGVLAMLLCAGLAVFDDLIWSRRGVIALATIAGVTAAGAIASAGRRRRERELANVTAVAEAAQRVLLRPVPRRVGPASLAVRYISASASARIGGDLYEVVLAGDAVRLIIGDAQGKGLNAVQTAAAVLGTFREAAYEAPDLPTLAARIEFSLQRQSEEEEFVTAILAELNRDGSRIAILNCGHPPPLLVSGPHARFVEPAKPGLPFGLFGLASEERQVDTICLNSGERLLLYTDGISEARDNKGSFYQLEGCASLIDGVSEDVALDRLGESVIRHVGHALLDDAAMIIISRMPCDAPQATVREQTDRSDAEQRASAPQMAIPVSRPGTSPTSG